MSCSKLLPPFTYDWLCYLNRDQLERFTIVCRPLKNFIERYFRSKPYRIFDQLHFCGGSYILFHNNVHWHPNRNDYSVQQFLAAQKCSIDNIWDDHIYHSFAEMRPYLGPTVRINYTFFNVVGGSIKSEHIEEMESITYLWRDGYIDIWSLRNCVIRIGAEDFQLILNSPTILQCRQLGMHNAYFSFKDYKVLYTVNVIKIHHCAEEQNDCWQQFLEQPVVKPVVVLHNFRREDVDNLIGRISESFSSAVSPNAFKIVFVLYSEELTEFRETNQLSGETLELKKGLPIEYQNVERNNCHIRNMLYYKKHNNYTLERSSI